jgi:hypothetical protein
VRQSFALRAHCRQDACARVAGVAHARQKNVFEGSAKKKIFTTFVFAAGM